MDKIKTNHRFWRGEWLKLECGVPDLEIGSERLSIRRGLSLVLWFNKLFIQ